MESGASAISRMPQRRANLERQIRGHAFVSVHLHPVTLAGELGPPELQLTTNVNEARLSCGVDDRWNVLHSPRVFAAAERAFGEGLCWQSTFLHRVTNE